MVIEINYKILFKKINKVKINEPYDVTEQEKIHMIGILLHT